ncbi:MAG TPA: efflux RND transporter permease subunit [Rhodothermales bacterium]|nr:efflux RND transporter permease subunit [Rhodothermales bacterium]
MASLTDLSIKRPVATTMFYLVVLTVGVVGLLFLPVDLLPPIEFPRLTVYTRYANVGPEEMEQIITDPIENALSGIPNLERMSSNSEEGISRVTLDFSQGTTIDEAANDVRAALDRIRDQIPLEAEQPGIWKFDPNRISIVTVSVESRRDMESLTRILEREIAQRFEQIPGVGTIQVRGGVYRQVNVDLKRDRLRAAGLTPLQVQQAISRENTTLPGGNVKEGVHDQYVRTVGEFESIEQIASTVVTIVDGAPVYVRDVAEVHDGFEDIQRLAELRGMPVIRLWIQKQSGANTVTVARSIREEVDRINTEREDLRMTVISDQSTFIQNSIDNVRRSAFWGGLLAVLVLYLFLRNGSSTFVIALAIPISVIATFGLLYFGGLTLNQMTFGGLALGIGLMVDNSIVVLENIVRHREEKGDSLLGAASHGAREVVGAIIASTLTTCVIFLPLAFTQTTSGALFQALAVVVVFALICSLLVAQTLVPVLASRFLSIKPAQADDQSNRARFMQRFAGWERRYAGFLEKALLKRYVVFSIALGSVVVALTLWPLIPIELAPQTDADEIDVDMEMAQGTNIAVVKEYLDELERAVRPLLPPGDIDSYSTEVRGSDAEIEIRMVPADQRSISSQELADRIRDHVEGMIPGARIRVQAQSGLWILRRIFSSGDGEDDVQIEIRGYDLGTADDVARQIIRRIEPIRGIADVQMSRREGRPEQNVTFDRAKIAQVGLSVEGVARAIQTAVGGSRAGLFRTEGEHFPIVVRLRPEDRLNVQDLDNIAVEAPGGRIIPVASLVEVERDRGPTSIRRVDGRRVTYVTATLESGVALGDAVNEIRDRVAGLPLPEGYAISFGGEYEEQQKAQGDFLIAVIMAFLLIYMVMAGQFERFLDPVIVMFAVPMAIVGVVPTLLLTGTTFNVQSAMGLVMLIGIVVNNAIVLVDYINLLRRERGMDVHDAVIEAGRLRLRPILMTTLTTIMGLLPLAIGLGAGTEIQAPLARVVIGGLAASTLITLVLIPTVYVSAYRVKEKLVALTSR